MAVTGRTPSSAAVLLGTLAACSGGKPRVGEDARRASTAAADAGSAAGPVEAAPAAETTGDVQVRVVWPDVPAAMRSSPGKTPCDTPRAPAVSPTATWGIGEVLVLVDGAPRALGDAMVQVADCAPTPRLAIGSAVVIASAADRPTRLELARHGSVAELRALGEPAEVRAVQLPIAGHHVRAPLEAGGVYRLATEGKAPETAWIVAAPGVVTDASGAAVVRDVPVGAHAVRAWLPPRGGQRARHATGEVTVVPGELAELTLTLAP